jgi:O-antigen ligase
MAVKKSTIYSKNFSNTDILLVLGVSFITLYISTKSMDPFNTPKLVALLIISSYFIGRLFDSLKTKPLRNSKVSTMLFLAISLFLLSSLVSVLFSDSLFVSFIGDTQRRNGLLAYLGLSILGLVAAQFIDFKNINNLLKISVLTGSIFSFYGLMQISGRDFATWDNPYNAVIATVGNPNFASALMAIFILLSLITLISKSMSKFFRLLSMLCIVMSISAIVASNSRQGLVSLAFGAMFFISTYSYLMRKKIGLAIILISGFISVFSIAGMLQKGPLTPFLYKGSVSVRGFYWEAAVEMFKSSPIVGVGLDHYGYYFKELRKVEYPLRHGFEITSSNAHNTFLQMFATGGLLLGISYLSIMVITFFVGIRLIKNATEHERIISIGMLSSWLAFQAQSVISIDNIGVSVWGWLLTGTIFGLARSKELEENDNKISKNQSLPKTQVKILPFFLTSIFIIPSIILSVMLMRVENNTAMVRNLGNDLGRQLDRSTNLSQQLIAELNNYAANVTNSPFSDPNYKLQVAYNLFNLGQISESLKLANDQVKQNPRNLYAIEATAVFSSEINDSTSAINARKKIATLDPWNAKNYLQLMLLYKSTGDITNAISMKERILSFAPETNEAKTALAEFEEENEK